MTDRNVCGAGEEWDAGARLALDALAMKPARGIPQWMIHLMEIPELEHFAGRAPGDYRRDVEGVYLDFQRRIGACLVDQYIPENPLSMNSDGCDPRAGRGATTGAETIEVDGMPIAGPEDVLAHLEQFEFPRLRQAIAEIRPAVVPSPLEGEGRVRGAVDSHLKSGISDFKSRNPSPGLRPPSPARGEGKEEDARVAALIEHERAIQRRLGPTLVKAPYDGFFVLPYLRYYTYGYVNYFMAVALYPEVMERDFALQADLATLRNATSARAIVEGRLPRVLRLDHDMADSRGTLIDPRVLDRIWFPHFARSIRPLLDAGVRLLWHCDGNLMAMVPRLIEAGIAGFQGFQYEDGMDYEHIGRMTDRQGGPLMIWAGVSVTRTLPMGTPADVASELQWLVRYGPPVGLCLGASSSICPGVPRANLEALFEGLKYYREHGRG
jgi:hypothetical protein